MKKQPLAPRGGNDKVYTPPDVAKTIVSHFSPFGRCMEPCAGKGAFVDALHAWRQVGEVDVCEMDQGIDFLALPDGRRYDWIVTNPPWSQFRPFLAKSMAVAENVVFLALLNAWFMRARVADMRAAGFGMVDVLMLPTPPKPWPQTGFQLAAVHVKHGFAGPVTFNYGPQIDHKTT